MPYYGDVYAGDPGLFSAFKKIKLGRIIGGVVKAAFPGAAGVLSAVRSIRGTPSAPPAKQTTIAVEGVKPGSQVYVTPIQQRRAQAIKGTKFVATKGNVRGGTTRAKAVSPFAQRMAAARRARLGR